jgi:hypothetical protein
VPVPPVVMVVVPEVHPATDDDPRRGRVPPLHHNHRRGRIPQLLNHHNPPRRVPVVVNLLDHHRVSCVVGVVGATAREQSTCNHTHTNDRTHHRHRFNSCAGNATSPHRFVCEY